MRHIVLSDVVFGLSLTTHLIIIPPLHCTARDSDPLVCEESTEIFASRLNGDSPERSTLPTVKLVNLSLCYASVAEVNC